MSFLWPQALWLLLAVPFLIAFYVLLLRRRNRTAVRYASVALFRDALTRGARIRRHVPPLMVLLALVVLTIAVARPRALLTLPSEQRTIILAMDTSLSMRATDVAPSRIAAARDAAKAFIKEQPADVRIGVVSFAGTATLVQRPTRDREELVGAVDRLQLQVHTAIGSAIITSLATLFPNDGLDADKEVFTSGSAREKARGAPIDRPRVPEKKEFKPVPPGSYRSGAIILLTDGRRTIGPDPLDAARMAADRGVKVYTVGFGSAAGGTANVEGYSIYMRFDEETLKAIAQLTTADYFHAGSAADLKKVYEGLNARYVLEREETEIGALFTVVAAALLIIAAGMSILWFSRIA